MEKMIARCGLVCTECEAYLATQRNDKAELDALVKKWGEMFQKDITLKDVLCDGCLSNTGRLCAYCYECGVRKCAETRNLVNCAVCPDYGCEILTGFWQFASKSKENLEAMRKGN
jgi:hypothetical protein